MRIQNRAAVSKPLDAMHENPLANFSHVIAAFDSILQEHTRKQGELRDETPIAAARPPSRA